MYRIFFSIIISFLFLLTLCISIIQPKLHKNIFLYNSDFSVEDKQEEKQIDENENMPSQTNNRYNEPKIAFSTDIPVIERNEPTITTTSAVKNEIKSVKTNQTVNKKTDTKNINVPQKETKAASQSTKQSVQKVIPTINENNKKETKNEIKNSDNISQNENIKNTEQIKQEEKIKQQEEVILWNKWRSQIQNKIMQDVKLPAMQEGIVFKFSFEVDKFGKITNIKTWSTTPMYTPYAIQYIAPVIRSYQGKDILNFPNGSTRFSTTVEGAWKISKDVKYSTPLDYNDTEKINR